MHNSIDDDRETCPHGDPFCHQRDDDDLPCFPCFMDAETDSGWSA